MTHNINAKVLNLYITKNDNNKTKVTLDNVNIDEYGVENDKFYAKDRNRSILITSTYSYKLAREDDIDIKESMLGENILIDANPYFLKEGDKIQIGNATLQITQNCTLCKSLSSIDARLPKLLKNDRGIFAKVIGEKTNIKIGDKVLF